MRNNFKKKLGYTLSLQGVLNTALFGNDVKNITF